MTQVWWPAGIGVALVLLLSARALAEDGFDCVMEPQRVIKLASPVAGVISQVTVDRGDLVTKGQVVAKLRDGLEKANLALAKAKASNDYALKSARASYEFMRDKHARAEALIGKGFVSKEDFDESLANARTAEQDVREAEANANTAQLELVQAEEVLKQ